METQTLIITAASIGFVHTLIGPDHYLPFILLGRARRWSLIKTSLITLLCGLGHVTGSVILGLIGILFGVAVGQLNTIESIRGDLSTWLLIGFGLAYMMWGLRIGLRAREHSHDHSHENDEHIHTHHHLGRHVHLHGNPGTVTPWALFIIFVLGPCEPLIPILMVPASRGSWWSLAGVTLSFGVTTILTMLTVVWIFYKGVIHWNLGWLEKYVHALSGLIIALSGLAIYLFEV